MRYFVLFALMMTLSACGGGGGGSTGGAGVSVATASTQTGATTTASTKVSDYAGTYTGVINSNLDGKRINGMKFSLTVGNDGKLSNFIITGELQDTSESRVIYTSGIESNGSILGQGSFNSAYGIVNTSFAGNIDLAGNFNITYTVSGGMSGTITIAGTKLQSLSTTTLPSVASVPTTTLPSVQISVSGQVK